MDILGVRIDNLIISEVLEKVERFMADDRQHYIVTSNPEFVVQAQKDEEFKEILNQSDLSVADGIGLIFASWFLRRPLKQRITGIDLMERICHLASQRNWSVLLLGGEGGVTEKTTENLQKKYKKLKIRIVNKNYLPTPNSPASLSLQRGEQLPNSILFVALGAPKQEKWISENLAKMPQIKLAMGVGGAFDFITEKVKRAPRIFRKCGLEWFWRFMFQPWRFRRIFRAVVVFPWLILRSDLKGLTFKVRP